MKRILLLITALLVLPAPAAAGAYRSGSTAYCLTGIMANGERVRAGSVAHNGYPLGTKLTIKPSPTGATRWVVRDRIGHGTQLDFWVPSCGTAIRWGRRTVSVRKGWRVPVYHSRWRLVRTKSQVDRHPGMW